MKLAHEPADLKISQAQMRVLRGLADLVLARGPGAASPTMREIGRALGLSINTVREKVIVLRRKGWLTSGPVVNGKTASRSIRPSPTFLAMEAFARAHGLECVGLRVVPGPRRSPSRVEAAPGDAP